MIKIFENQNLPEFIIIGAEKYCIVKAWAEYVNDPDKITLELKKIEEKVPDIFWFDSRKYMPPLGVKIILRYRNKIDDSLVVSAERISETEFKTILGHIVMAYQPGLVWRHFE